MRRHHLTPQWLMSGAWFMGGLAALLAMVIVFGQLSTLRNQLDAQSDAAACRSRLAVEVTVATAINQIAFSDLLVALASQQPQPAIANAIQVIENTGARLTSSAKARQEFELSPTQTCPLGKAER